MILCMLDDVLAQTLVVEALQRLLCALDIVSGSAQAAVASEQRACFRDHNSAFNLPSELRVAADPHTNACLVSQTLMSLISRGSLGPQPWPEPRYGPVRTA